ncbi:MAG TPA: glycosyltransferase family 1 protein [Actinomycetota bacterium]|nr:glycosyltransferase family 1 protein [Actinomycetota bacterium]
MRVLLDATSLPGHRLGAGQYVLNLARAVAGLDVDLHVMAKEIDAADLAGNGTVHTTGVRTRPARLLWEQTVLPRRARRLRPDVFHGPHYTLPRALGSPGVVTFHDPTFFTMPEVHEPAKVAFFTRAARAGVARARRVVAVSGYAARGAIEHAGADPDRVDVVPLGVDHSRFTPEGDDADAELRSRAGVHGSYLMWVGALEPRKDVPTLVRAYAALAAQGLDHSLVLVGPDAWGTADIERAIQRSGVRDRILRTGYVSEDTKAALYRGASVVAVPSLAEGFGIPVLEAMACGCPVVTTTGSACEEVGGEAVLLVEPRDAGALADAIGSVLTDPGVESRLRRAGPTRAAGYTWERTAQLTVETYRRAA